MTGNTYYLRKTRGGNRILAPLTVSSLVVILLVACILPVTAANVTTTATTTATFTTTHTTTATTSPTATATHTTQTTAVTTTATTAATTTATATSTTTTATTATTVPVTTTTTASTNQVQPVAGFTSDTTSGPSPLMVQFTDLSTGGPVSWTWDFGDGGSDTTQNPSHTYSNSGSYTVTLTAVNRQGTNYQKSEPGYITVDEVTATPTETGTTDSTALAAAFSGYPLNGTGTLTVQFTDSSSGSPDGWSWDFGDDTTSSDQNPSHAYTNTGVYTVSLKITKSGETDQTSKVSYITVAAVSTTSATITPTNTDSLIFKSVTSPGTSKVYSTPIPTPIIRQTQAQANVTPVLTGQAWLDRENKKLAEAEALAASGQPTDIVSRIVSFFKGIFPWL